MLPALLASLGVVCPSCDHLNPPAARDCEQCHQATGFGAPAPTRAAAPAAPKPAGGSTARDVPPGMRARVPGATPPRGVTPAAPPIAARPASPGPSPVAELPRKAPAAPIPLAAPAAEPTKKAAPPAAARFGLVVLAGSARGQRYKLPAQGPAAIGRTQGLVLFPDDPCISPQHATLFVREGRLFVRDEGGTSGVFVGISGQEQLAPGALFACGQRAFRYAGPLAPGVAPSGQPITYGAPLPPAHRVEEMLMGGRPGRAALITTASFAIGRAQCEWAFPGDEQLAPRHCELVPNAAGAMLRDVSDGLGTFVRLAPQGERPLQPGDRLLVGQQVLQIEQATA